MSDGRHDHERYRASAERGLRRYARGHRAVMLEPRVEPGTHERARALRDGLGVTVQRTCARSRSDRVLRLGILLIAAAALVTGTLAGLARVGLHVMSVNPVMHGPLMVCGFIGTVIGLERAIALRNLSAFVAPLTSAAATVAMIASLPGAVVFMVLASALLVVLSTATYLRQRAP